MLEQNHLIPKIIFSLSLICFSSSAIAEPEQGLVATYRDDVQAVSRVVALPELGLAGDEAPHPAIKPVFNAKYAGTLLIKLPGTYEFDSKASLWLDGKAVTGAVALTAGSHALELNYTRPAGTVALGLSWQSEHFIKEPVPPSALQHEGKVEQTDVAGAVPSPSFRIAKTMTEMKCASCHEADFLATMHHKFSIEALLPHMRHANPMKWYGSMTGPLFEESEMLTQLAKDLNQLPRGDRKPEGTPQDPANGIAMVGTKVGLACIACHDIKDYKTPAESKGPNLAYVAQRVSYDWFVRWMSNPQRIKPGVPMPSFFAAEKPDERQAHIDALWAYLSQREKMAMPEELVVNPNLFALKAGATPLVNRAYIRLPDGRELLRAICVGLPNGMSYCFDAETCRLAYVWTGGFLDMEQQWKNQSGYPTPPIGEKFYLPAKEEGLRIADTAAVYHGYELVDGIPRFEFTIGEASVQLRIDSPTMGQVRQSFLIGKSAEPVEFIGPSDGTGISAKASGGNWEGNRLVVPAEGKMELIMEVKK